MENRAATMEVWIRLLHGPCPSCTAGKRRNERSRWMCKTVKQSLFLCQMLIRLWTTAKKHCYKVSESYWRTFARTQNQAGDQLSYSNTGLHANTRRFYYEYFTKRKRHIADEEKIKLLPKSRNSGRSNDMTNGEVQIFQPLPDCPNKIHTIEMLLIGKIQCEDRAPSTSFGVPEISR